MTGAGKMIQRIFSFVKTTILSHPGYVVGTFVGSALCVTLGGIPIKRGIINIFILLITLFALEILFKIKKKD